MKEIKVQKSPLPGMIAGLTLNVTRTLIADLADMLARHDLVRLDLQRAHDTARNIGKADLAHSLHVTLNEIAEANDWLDNQLTLLRRRESELT